MLARIFELAVAAAFALVINTQASAQAFSSQPSPVRGLTHAETIIPAAADYHKSLIAEEDYWCKNLACRAAFENARVASIEVVHAALAQDLAEIRSDDREMRIAHQAWVAAKARSDAAWQATRKFAKTTGSKK